MSLEGRQVEQVTGALISGFSKAELTRLVHAALDTRLEEIVAPNSALSDMAYEVVTKCDRDGTVATLIDAACKAKPNNPDLRRLAEDSRRWPLDAPRPAQRTVYPPVGNRALPPPADFVPRPEEYNALLAYLLAEDGPSGPIGITGLYGAGGYGKTTLAQALCHDPAVIARYPDGILWVELKEEPGDPIPRLLDQVAILTGRRPEFRSLDAAQSEFAAALGERHLLLVMDDVWQYVHLEPFLQGGPNCTRLVTTRRDSVLHSAKHRVRVDRMTESEAAGLLKKLLGRENAEGQDAGLERLARRLGRWPFLLRPAGATLRDYVENGMMLANAMHQVNDELTEFGLDAFTDPENLEDRRIAVAACIGVSLRRLMPDEQVHFSELAVFPEDAGVPFSALEMLWSLSPVAAIRLCRRLADLSLCQAVDFAERTLRLHDVMRTYLIEKCGKDNLLALHGWFLDSYGLADWTNISADEPYLWDHLAYHLDAAGRHDALRALFADDLWLQARVAHDGYIYDGYIADLNIAWAHAHAEARQQIDASGPAPALAESIHYSLIRTSINSLSSNYVPELVARAVEIGFWPPSRGLGVALKVLDPASCLRFLTLLLCCGSFDARQQEQVAELALKAIDGLWSDWQRAEILPALATQLTGDSRARVLVGGLSAAEAIQNEEQRAEALAALAPLLYGPLLDRGFAAAKTIRKEQPRAHVLVALAPQLRGSLLEHALAAVEAIKGAEWRAEVLTALAPQLTGAMMERTLEHALAAAEAIPNDTARAVSLGKLVPQLSGALLTRAMEYALAAVEAIKGEEQRAEVLIVLTPKLSGALFQRALAVAEAIQYEGLRARVLAALALQLGSEEQRDILERSLLEASAIRNEGSRGRALALLALQLSGEQKEQALERGLAAAKAIPDEKQRAKVLVALGPQLRSELLERALGEARTLRNERLRAEVLVTLIPQLSSALLGRVLSAAKAGHDERSRIRILAALAPRLSGAFLKHALAPDIRDQRPRTHMLTVLAPYLSNERRQRLVGRKLLPGTGVVSPQLSRQPGRELLAYSLAAAEATQDAWSRARALAALIPHLVGEQRERAVRESMAAAESIRNEWPRAEALAVLAPHLSGEQRQYALELGLAAAEAIPKDGARAELMAALVPYLSGVLLQRALEQGLSAAEAIGNNYDRARALASFLLVAPDPALTLRQVRLALDGWLLADASNSERTDLLGKLSDPTLLAPPIFDQASLDAIAQSIMDVCWEWRWL